jgi:hypothetical protein
LRALPSYEILKEGSRAVKDWLDCTIGNVNAFLASCMLTQDGDCNFFAMEKLEQKKLIDNVFSLNAVQKLELLLKEACRAHSLVSENLHAYLAGRKERKGSGSGSKEVLEAQLEELEGKLLGLEGDIAAVHTKWNHLSPKTFLKEKRDYEVELALVPDDGEERVRYEIEWLKSERAVLMSKVSPGALQVRKPEGPVLAEEGLQKQIQQWSAECREVEGVEGEGDVSLKSIAACRLVLDEKRIWLEGWKRTKGVPFPASSQEDLAAEEEELRVLGQGKSSGSTKDLPRHQGRLENLLDAKEYRKNIIELEEHEQGYTKIEGAW